MSAPTIGVAGLGRCGSSLTLQMLDAAGVPTVGSFPSYEDDDRLAELTWHQAFEGRAFKLIDPHRWVALPPKLDLLIWLDRDPSEQAASQYKFAHFFASGGQIDIGSRAQRKAMAGILRRDHARANKALAAVPTAARLDLTFEGLLRAPKDALVAIADRLGIELDDMAADVVLPRAPTCWPGLLELKLMGIAA